ncbi:sucrase ferredoxin [Nocardioides sp.]|uniref:sucrase ferredoxin n=1 Tax=Nocardioides sp. TaxID=35761 RepID=UPI0027350114|nr:sucrase ferredoxin [Nocardioides sp.]MDP3891490.1 sucrase ferredoxin [Nocardioides sp.]
MTHDFRCTTASREAPEPMAGTAPTERAWLCVEHPGAWGRNALAESRLPATVRERLTDLAGVRVLLIRRHGGRAGSGVRVFAGWLGPGEPWVETAVLDDVVELLDLDLAGLATGRRPGLAAYDARLWLVCTNGRRDRCCAEIGRPVTAALAERWPEETWETTHLGGHRFAGTLLALPSGVCLGRLDAETAVECCQEIEAGRHPVAHSRGRAGLPAPAQVAGLAVHAATGEQALGAVQIDHPTGSPMTGSPMTGTVTGRVGSRPWQVEVVIETVGERRQSCADLKLKATTAHRAVRVVVGD